MTIPPRTTPRIIITPHGVNFKFAEKIILRIISGAGVGQQRRDYWGHHGDVTAGWDVPLDGTSVLEIIRDPHVEAESSKARSEAKERSSAPKADG